MLSRMTTSGFVGALLLLSTSVQAERTPFYDALVAAALERTEHWVIYDGSYRAIPYPMGDVADNRGVCTDVVIRSYRAVGIDLQQLVHEDMRHDFADYPALWGLTRPDPNIDHRRVPNLRRFFERQGAALPVSEHAGDYLPGDLVTWMLPNNRPHIGIVSNQRDEVSGRPLIVHNIGWGPRLDDALFEFRITGHYRFDSGRSREMAGAVGEQDG